MTEQEIKDKIHELEQPDFERNNELHDLRIELRELQKKKLQPLVGRCFRDKHDRIFIITGTPQEKFLVTGTCEFNPYQIPVRMIAPNETEYWRNLLRTNGCEEIYDATVHSRAVLSDNPLQQMRQEYEEISVGKFRIIAHEIVDKFIDACIRNEQI